MFAQQSTKQPGQKRRYGSSNPHHPDLISFNRTPPMTKTFYEIEEGCGGIFTFPLASNSTNATCPNSGFTAAAACRAVETARRIGGRQLTPRSFGPACMLRAALLFWSSNLHRPGVDQRPSFTPCILTGSSVCLLSDDHRTWADGSPPFV